MARSVWMLKPEQRKLVKLITDLLVKHGAVTAEVKKASPYPWSLDTCHGPLSLGVDGKGLGVGIFARFEDVERAVAGAQPGRAMDLHHVRVAGHEMNRHSGKWNWAWCGRVTAEECAAEFARALDALAPTVGAAPRREAVSAEAALAALPDALLRRRDAAKTPAARMAFEAAASMVREALRAAKGA